MSDLSDDDDLGDDWQVLDTPDEQQQQQQQQQQQHRQHQQPNNNKNSNLGDSISSQDFNELNMKDNTTNTNSGELKQVNGSPANRRGENNYQNQKHRQQQQQNNGIRDYYNQKKNKLLASFYNAYRDYSNDHNDKAVLDNDEPIWFLGKCFEPGTINDKYARNLHLRDFELHVQSLLFCSYRKNFPKISGTQFTSDAGWGCMLRTGQMLLARALLSLVMPKSWILSDSDLSNPYSPYRKMVRQFCDHPNRPYSIHALIAAHRRANPHQALAVGSWFAPTEVACAIRDVVRRNHEELLQVYVARDGVLCKQHVLALARGESVVSSGSSLPSVTSVATSVQSSSTNDNNNIAHDNNDVEREASSLLTSSTPSISSSSLSSSSRDGAIANAAAQQPQQHRSAMLDSASFVELPASSHAGDNVTARSNNNDDEDPLSSSGALPDKQPSPSSKSNNNNDNNTDNNNSTTNSNSNSRRSSRSDASDSADATWNPVLLLLPVRLGVDTLHQDYVAPLRAMFHLPQSVGVFGGRPRQSLYFVGVQGDNVFYLDPHVVQPAQSVDAAFDDKTNHVVAPRMMPLADIDPSMTVGFLLRSNHDFETVCARVAALQSSNVHLVSLVDELPHDMQAQHEQRQYESLLSASVPASLQASTHDERIAWRRNSRSYPEGELETTRRRTQTLQNGAATAQPQGNEAATTNAGPPQREFDLRSTRVLHHSAVLSLAPGGALLRWLEKRKWKIVEHMPPRLIDEQLDIDPSTNDSVNSGDEQSEKNSSTTPSPSQSPPPSPTTITTLENVDSPDDVQSCLDEVDSTETESKPRATNKPPSTNVDSKNKSPQTASSPSRGSRWQSFFKPSRPATTAGAATDDDSKNDTELTYRVNVDVLNGDTTTKRPRVDHRTGVVFLLAHAPGIHIHFRPQLEVLFERDISSDETPEEPCAWKTSVHYYAVPKPGTASAMGVLTGGLSLVVAAGTITKYKNDSKNLVEQIWNVLDPPHAIIDI